MWVGQCSIEGSTFLISGRLAQGTSVPMLRTQTCRKTVLALKSRNDVLLEYVVLPTLTSGAAAPSTLPPLPLSSQSHQPETPPQPHPSFWAKDAKSIVSSDAESRAYHSSHCALCWTSGSCLIAATSSSSTFFTTAARTFIPYSFPRPSIREAHIQVINSLKPASASCLCFCFLYRSPWCHSSHFAHFCHFFPFATSATWLNGLGQRRGGCSTIVTTHDSFSRKGQQQPTTERSQKVLVLSDSHHLLVLPSAKNGNPSVEMEHVSPQMDKNRRFIVAGAVARGLCVKANLLFFLSCLSLLGWGGVGWGGVG